MIDSRIRLHCVVSAPFSENSYILGRLGNTACVVVDPGFDPEAIVRYIDQEGLSPEAILLTHGHSDHIAGNELLKERWPECPLVIGQDDAEKLTDPWLNLSAPFGLELRSPPADRCVTHGERLAYAGLEWEVRWTPGHSRGHVVYVCHEAQPTLVVGGDVLFRRGIGRTDFPDGSHRDLLRSIREELFTLPPDTIVLPGHGGPTTTGEEERENPFLS